MQKQFIHSFKAMFFGVLAVLAIVVLAACSADGAALGNSLSQANANQQAKSSPFTFSMVPSSSAIKACLPNAAATVTITKGELNETMRVRVTGLVPNTGYDLFVLEIPHKPFGIAWYQSDLQTNSRGDGDVTVKGIFNVETFSISQGGPTTTFGATHQYHLGLWFNDPNVPFNHGCEPGSTSPIVTPFNGEQHAGIQVLNTSNFSDDAGPLSHVA